MADQRIYYQNQGPLFPTGRPLRTPASSNPTANSGNSAANNTLPFSQILQQELSGVKFSQHAVQRLQSRNIQLNSTDLTKLNSAVEKASQKGAKESLVLMNNLALVVSVKNKTVITAMDGASMKDNVFTNIDSAIIL